MSSAQRPSLPANNGFRMASQSHTLRQRAEVYDIRNAYSESDRSYHSSSSSEQSYRQRNSDSDRSYQTQPTEYSGSPVQRPIIHHGYTVEGRIERLPERYFPEKEPQSSPRASVETYASTVPSEEDFGDDGTPEYDLPEYTARPYESDVLPATPSDFSELFPSGRRLAIRHDDSTLDGNMNLRVDTEIRSDGHTTDMTLFHLRMHDLKNREFSLRRYCRDSGREVCHSVRKNQAPVAEKRPGFQRSLSNALSVMRPKSESRAPTLSSLRRNDSGYGSMHDSDFDIDERPRSSGNISKPQQQMTQTIKLEFSNYAQVNIKRTGAKANKRYEFEYWGIGYAWKRVVKKEGHSKEVSFNLVRVGTEQPLAYIVPVPLSRPEAQQERQKGGWIPPCSMWISDERIVKSQKDVSDVIVSAGLIALVDNTVRERFHSKATKQMLLPKVEYVGPKRLINEMFRRDSGNTHSNQSRSGSRSRPSTSHAGSTSSRTPTGAMRQASNEY